MNNAEEVCMTFMLQQFLRESDRVQIIPIKTFTPILTHQMAVLFLFSHLHCLSILVERKRKAIAVRET